MKLEMRYFDVADARFGERTAYADGHVTINKAELLTALGDDARIRIKEIEIVRPQERTRINNVLDIVEPRFKPEHGGYFPGMAAPLWRAGDSATHVLRGLAVLESGRAEYFSGAVVDMAGPGAELTPYSKTHNICLVTEPVPGIPNSEHGRAIKTAGLKAAVYLGKATIGLNPTAYEAFDLRHPAGGKKRFARIAYLFQLHSHGSLREPFIYGENSKRYYPTILHPNEILDGAIVCGHYNIWTAFKNCTYSLLNHPLIRDLYYGHGKRHDFCGVVIVPEPTSLAEIRRSAMMAANLLKYTLKADGVIITKEGGGHADVDLMENCDACERYGIKTVLIDSEWRGPDGCGTFPLLAHSKNADAMVSVGNVEAVSEFPALEKIIGGRRLLYYGENLDQSRTLPLRFFSDAVNHLGLNCLTTASGSARKGEPLKRTVFADRRASKRAIEMLQKKLAQKPFRTEITLPGLDLIEPAPPVGRLNEAIVALITEGGLIPQQKIKRGHPASLAKYNLKHFENPGAFRFDPRHQCYDTVFINADLNRMAPLDALLELQSAGRIKTVYPSVFVVTAAATTLDNTQRIGRRIARELYSAGVSAALVTST